MHNPIKQNDINDRTERIPEPDSFPSRGNDASAAVSFEEDTRKQLNLLRERTFNPELRRLVDRIRVNEPATDTIGESEPVGGLSDEDLHLRLYRLLYKARNLRDNREINISFNPFTVTDESSSGNIVGAVGRTLTAMMRHLSLSPFALMSYNISEKGYIPSICDLDGDKAVNIIISLNDNLFQKIRTARDGIVIDASEFRDDPYLGKIFTRQNDTAHSSCYYIMLHHIIDVVAKELSPTGSAPLSSFLPSAILMIVLDDRMSKSEPSELARIIRERLSMPLFILNDSQSLVFSLDRYDDLSSAFNVLDYLFTLFLLKKDRVGISLHIKSSDGSNMSFMTKYIISKLNNKLNSDSVIVNVLKDRLIILTESSFIGTIRAILDEYSTLFENSFTIQEFRASEFSNAQDIIHRIILNY